MFALVDCNNFYASCERVFQPRLEGRAILVLSNNDGCVIARSHEAKALGIPMGLPFFKLDPKLRRQVMVFSSNYALYGDLSRRVMQVLAGFAPRIEVYSIDECFLDLSGVADPTALGQAMARTVRQWTGIPVSVGIAPTKTLAKLANRLAKQGQSPDGPVLDWARLPDPAATLAGIPVEDVWGIAQRWGQRLRALGLADALALREAEPRWLRQQCGVVLERLGWELRGRVLSAAGDHRTSPPTDPGLAHLRRGGDHLARAARGADPLCQPRGREAARPGSGRPGADGLHSDRSVRHHAALLYQCPHPSPSSPRPRTAPC